ncbi:hypothetical protein [Sphingomonas sp. EC-HK361]|uniref:hypothetical protein n=1 Tax=Sphingomonas sp. EC-HK361 TaxID=2038397 RepID=UPI00125F0BD8|nr:hypothetical protein [Sphingomonas sp. EC-HK361]
MPDRHIFSGRVAVPDRHRGPAFFLIRAGGSGQEEGKRRKQEKGNASKALPSGCLHIVFLRDMPRSARDMLVKIGGNPPFLLGNPEIHSPAGAQR